MNEKTEAELTAAARAAKATAPASEQPTQLVEIEIPREILVACPLRQFKSRSAAKCEGCEYFKGLVDRFPGSEFPFDQRYMVTCCGPVHRRLTLIELADD